MMDSKKLYFVCDYMEGAHPNILNRMIETNYDHTSGYGFDPVCESAKDRIRKACQCPEAEIHFLVGGTQTNSTVIRSLLGLYQGVIAADTGHISLHESGAIEAGGHKVLTLPAQNGKINSMQVKQLLEDYYDDENHDHMVSPGMVYISHPTEYGSLYSLTELESLSKICHDYQIPLYVDGARMAYAFASKENDISLADFARLCDAFYIGGTKCGALIGEAVVLPKKDLIPHFFTIIKQSGALLAKGRLLGIQFDELFRDDLYMKIGMDAVSHAQRLQTALLNLGYTLYFPSPTNQIFVVMDKRTIEELSAKVAFDFWEKIDENHNAIRFATSWATKGEDVDALIEILRKQAKKQ